MEAVRLTSHTLSHFAQHSIQLCQELGGQGRKDGEPSSQGIYRRSSCDGGKKTTDSRRSFLQKRIGRKNSTPFRCSQRTLRVCYLAALIHSLSLEEPDLGDRDHAMVRKPRGFRRVRTGLSISMESQALFSSFKKSWMSTRNTIQYHEFHFVLTQVLAILSVGPS